MKTLTVVTVTYNAEAAVERTLRSVVGQTAFDGIEYIVVDGGSTDDTIAVVNRYLPHLAAVVSEPDRGIYDAMNKGARIATGRWILYMNAGDTFYDTDTVASLGLDGREADHAVYGDCILVTRNGQEHRKAHPFFDCPDRLRGIGICHQALYCPTEWLRRRPFDWQRFPICADYDLARHYWEQGARFDYVPRPLCVYGWGEGLSSVPAHFKDVLRENAVISHRACSAEYLKEYLRLVTQSFRKSIRR